MESLLSATVPYENVSSLHEFLSSSYSHLIRLYEEMNRDNISGGTEAEGSSSYLLSSVSEEVFQGFANPNCQKWIYTIIACILVGLSGVFPLLVIPTVPSPSSGDDASSKSAKRTLDSSKPFTGIGPKNLKCLLSFAVGSLLGDVFLHLLPEAWESALAAGSTSHDTLMLLGIWILVGMVLFLICEKLASYGADEEELEPELTTPNNNKDFPVKPGELITTDDESSQKKIAGYLNLVANGFDNFTHGLAVAGSFIISPRIGFLTTAAILLHEIPHEIGDFAILLRSGFNPWSAAKAQISTATIGLIGAIFTLSVDCMQTVGNFTWWILPFTAGCFINIALTNLLPDLVKEKCPKESIKQFICLMLGIGVMGFVTITFEC